MYLFICVQPGILFWAQYARLNYSKIGLYKLWLNVLLATSTCTSVGIYTFEIVEGTYMLLYTGTQNVPYVCKSIFDYSDGVLGRFNIVKPTQGTIPKETVTCTRICGVYFFLHGLD